MLETHHILQWATDRGLIKEENAPKQLVKVMEELGETAAAYLKGDKAKQIDGIGDCFVTLIILSAQLGVTPEECLEAAWQEIKDRKGETKNGIFIKN